LVLQLSPIPQLAGVICEIQTAQTAQTGSNRLELNRSQVRIGPSRSEPCSSRFFWNRPLRVTGLCDWDDQSL